MSENSRMEEEGNYEYNSERTGVRYHEVSVYRLLHRWGFKPKTPRKRFVNIASKEEGEQFKKCGGNVDLLIIKIIVNLIHKYVQ